MPHAPDAHLGGSLAVQRLLQPAHQVWQPLACALVQLRLARHLVAAQAMRAAFGQQCSSSLCISGPRRRKHAVQTPATCSQPQASSCRRRGTHAVHHAAPQRHVRVRMPRPPVSPVRERHLCARRRARPARRWRAIGCGAGRRGAGRVAVGRRRAAAEGEHGLQALSVRLVALARPLAQLAPLRPAEAQRARSARCTRASGALSLPL